MWEQNQELDAEDFIHPPLPTLHFQLQDTRTYQSQTLIIGLYGASSLFVSSLISPKNVKLSNRINFTKAKQISLADIYAGEGKNIFLIFNDQFEKMKEVYFAQFITKTFKFKKCIIIDAVAQTTLQNPTNACMQSICTSFWEEKSLCNKFEQGVMGVGADVLGWGEMNKIGVICLIGIMGEYELSHQAIESIFGSLRGKFDLEDQVDIQDKIRKYNMKKYANKIYL